MPGSSDDAEAESSAGKEKVHVLARCGGYAGGNTSLDPLHGIRPPRLRGLLLAPAVAGIAGDGWAAELEQVTAIAVAIAQPFSRSKGFRHLLENIVGQPGLWEWPVPMESSLIMSVATRHEASMVMEGVSDVNEMQPRSRRAFLRYLPEEPPTPPFREALAVVGTSSNVSPAPALEQLPRVHVLPLQRQQQHELRRQSVGCTGRCEGTKHSRWRGELCVA